MALVGEIIIVIGLIFMSLGVIGIFKFRNFYPRLLVTCKIDTVGTITVLIGVMVKHGFSFFSLRILLLLGLILIVSPMVTYIIARFAYMSGHKLEGKTGKAKTNDDLTE